jgi:hypothetical protein
MSHQDEVAVGLGLVTGLAIEQKCALITRRFDNRMMYYCKFSRGNQFIDFTLSEEFLADLPGTPSYQKETKEAFWAFGRRLGNVSPNDFYSRSGTPFTVEMYWPFNQHPSRDVIWLKVNLKDIRYPDLIAKTAVVLGLPLNEFDLRHAPFKRLAVIVNGVRTALDNSKLEFYSSDGHPNLLQEIPIWDLPSAARFSDQAIQQFLVGKVYWLGFIRGRKDTQVWIADPWDAAYLGVSVNDLIRAAETQQARRLIRLSSDGEFASAEDPLIASVASTESNRRRNPIGFAQ